MADERMTLGKILLDKGVVTQAQLEDALQEADRANRKIGEVLVAKGFATENDVAWAMAKQTGFPFIQLSTYRIEEAAAKLFSKDFAVQYKIIPLFRLENSLTVAMTNPFDMSLIDHISRLAGGLRIRPVVASAEDIKSAIARIFEVSIPGGIPVTGKVGREPGIADDRSSTGGASVDSSQAPIIRLVDEIFTEAVELEASDIHFEPQGDTFYCRLRIDGNLKDPKAISKELQLAVASRIKIMANMDISETRIPQDGRIATTISGKEIDIRIASFPTIFGEHLSARLLDKSKGILSLESLGLDEKALVSFKELINRSYGMILVTGPTGSGKTTTLYSSLSAINDQKKNILTLEDPVEYTIPRVHHAQINVRAGLTFAAGLRSMLRMDPDVIMIGEIRDKETADIAIHASLTGHLVFSTIHTNDAASAVARLINIGVEPYLVTSSLAGVLAQRLIRTLCPRCKKSRPITSEEREIIGHNGFTQAISDTVCEAVGCPACRKSGYKGRIGIYELMIPDPEMRDLMVKKAPASILAELCVRKGMKTLRADGISKFLNGVTSLADALSETEES